VSRAPGALHVKIAKEAVVEAERKEIKAILDRHDIFFKEFLQIIIH
jgi:hypothetical protein